MIARDLTFAAYALIAVALITLQAATWRRGTLTLGQLTDRLMCRLPRGWGQLIGVLATRMGPACCQSWGHL